ncbi:hypothetical protein T310_8726, partial [Rasamsonia emersonii CBS 393.64]
LNSVPFVFLFLVSRFLLTKIEETSAVREINRRGHRKRPQPAHRVHAKPILLGLVVQSVHSGKVENSCDTESPEGYSGRMVIASPGVCISARWLK